ncbi:MAG: metallophosphoesterase [Firmicutes bacterium]|nr:metallophosphoesterase [Bacillota bacterium]MCL1953823.1 metallophosphoesterase [Bacillota bacterium]
MKKQFETNTYSVKCKDLPQAFDGFKIALVSDLHDWDYQGRLEDVLRQVKPDMIALVGDIVQRRFEGHHLETLFRNFVSIAPTYYVSGNHEARIKMLDKILDSIANTGCVVLEDKLTTFLKGGSQIVIMGQSDVQRHKHLDMSKKKIYKQKLLNLLKKCEVFPQPCFKILLAHRPEYFEYYADKGVNLSLSGHVHGGQIRIMNRALYGLNQGFFPKYSAGLYTRGSNSIVVSRGLGHTKYTPLRVNNTPELAIVELNLDV